MNILNNIKNFIGSSQKSYRFSLFQGNELSKGYEDKHPLDLFELSLYLNRALIIKGENVGDIKFFLKNEKGEEIFRQSETKDEKAKTFLKLLEQPNQIIPRDEFWKLYQIYKDTTGEAIIYVEKTEKEIFSKEQNIISLHLLNPTEVSVEYNEDGTYKLFKHKSFNGKTVSYLPNEIIRTYFPNPKNQLKALSPIRAGTKEINTSIQLTDYMSKTLKNGGRVDSILRIKQEGGLSEEQILELKEQYKRQFAEAQRTGNPMIMSGEGDYVHLALNPQELAYLQSKSMTINDISALTGVPKSLFANVDDAKYSNLEESKNIFLSDTISKADKKLVNSLKSIVPEGYELGFVDPAPTNKEEKRKDIELANNLQVLKLNEIRTELGYDPVEDEIGDKIYKPMNMIPVEKYEPEEESKQNQKKN